MLDSLVELARDSSDAKRHQLVDHVTDLYSSRAHTRREEELTVYNGLLEGVYDRLSVQDRKTIAERLSSIDSTSPSLALKLATDDIEIARPILEKSYALKEPHLLEVASTMDQGHLQSLARRNYLSSRLTQKLVERGNREVKGTVAMNIGAELSPEDLERIIAELPKQMGDKIRHLRKSTDDLVKELYRDPSEAMVGDALPKRPRRMEPDQWIAGIRAGHVSLVKAVSQLAFEKNLLDITHLLAAALGMSQAQVAHYMTRYDATGTSVLCRAAGIPDSEYAAICKARCAHLKFPASTGNKWLTNYHVLSPEDAKRMTSLLKAKLRFTGTLQAA